MTVGKKIRQMREEAGLSQEELAQKAGVSRTYILQLESDRSSKPSAIVLFHIAESLGTTIAELLGKINKQDSDDLELTPGMKEAIKMFPVLKEVQKEMPTWKHRNKYPATPAEWFIIYNILKNGNKS